MKILIVGGAGYVGGAVTDLLRHHADTYPAEAHDLLVYDSLVYEDYYLKPVPFLQGDIRDRDRLLPLLRWADAVVWLAAVVGDAACALDPDLTREVNEESVRWLAANFRGRIVFTSTCSVYGAQDSILNESSPTLPLSVYAQTKLAAEAHLADANSNFIAFRLGTLFGLGDQFSRLRFDLVVNTLTLRAHRDNKITVFGGEQYRPLLHVQDAARAIVAAIDQTPTGIFNLHRNNTTISRLAGTVATYFPGLQVERTPALFEDSRNYRVTSEKAERELKFRPYKAPDAGVCEIRDLLRSGRIPNLSNPRWWNDKYLTKGEA